MGAAWSVEGGEKSADLRVISGAPLLCKYRLVFQNNRSVTVAARIEPGATIWLRELPVERSCFNRPGE